MMDDDTVSPKLPLPILANTTPPLEPPTLPLATMPLMTIDAFEVSPAANVPIPANSAPPVPGALQFVNDTSSKIMSVLASQEWPEAQPMVA